MWNVRLMEDRPKKQKRNQASWTDMVGNGTEFHNIPPPLRARRGEGGIGSGSGSGSGSSSRWFQWNSGNDCTRRLGVLPPICGDTGSIMKVLFGFPGIVSRWIVQPFNEILSVARKYHDD